MPSLVFLIAVASFGYGVVAVSEPLVSFKSIKLASNPLDADTESNDAAEWVNPDQGAETEVLEQPALFGRLRDSRVENANSDENMLSKMSHGNLGKMTSSLLSSFQRRTHHRDHDKEILPERALRSRELNEGRFGGVTDNDINSIKGEVAKNDDGPNNENDVMNSISGALVGRGVAKKKPEEKETTSLLTNMFDSNTFNNLLKRMSNSKSSGSPFGALLGGSKSSGSSSGGMFSGLMSGLGGQRSSGGETAESAGEDNEEAGAKKNKWGKKKWGKNKWGKNKWGKNKWGKKKWGKKNSKKSSISSKPVVPRR